MEKDGQDIFSLSCVWGDNQDILWNAINLNTTAVYMIQSNLD